MSEPEGNSRASMFWIVVAGVLAGLALWHVGAWLWLRFGWWSVGLAGGAFVLANIAHIFKCWLDGRRGLAQWPDPHGRYYEEWLRLADGAGDYYDWLAEKMQHREPWKTWAVRDRMLREQTARDRGLR